MKKLVRFFNTVKYLKFIQVYYRLFYFARNIIRKFIGFKYSFSNESASTTLKLLDSIENSSSYKAGEFDFLNLSKKFESEIDWNYNEHGKLWTYNLTYFEYLKDKDDVSLIYDFIDSIGSVRDGLEPFPISLRGINWIKFLIKNEIQDEKVDNSLYAQYYILLDNLEYHLLGNHMLENGFSLLFGAYYFQDEVLYKKAKEILTEELEEQILDDGAHFELSPMYHQIMLFRVLDCINLLQNNNWKNQELLKYLEKKASSMLEWLKNISFESGEIPLLNDSTNKIAPTTDELNEYAKRLGLNHQLPTANYKLLESGYRKIKKEKYECVIDVGQIGPSYITGHAHADTFNFELYIENKPFIVDTGLNTYDAGKIRDSERSTKAHNTVDINGDNSSEVWGSFRVVDRANIIELIENIDHIQATHDGYKNKYGILHTREWKFEENKIIIDDSLNKECEAVARLHFHPDISEDEIKKRINTNQQLQIVNYKYACEFNKTLDALVIEILFKKDLKVEINI